MKEPKFLARFEEAVGKTIEGISVDFGVGIVAFTDGTALAFDSDVDCDDSVELSVSSEPRLTSSKWSMAANDAGLMTHEEWMECNRVCEMERAAELRRRAELIERDNA